MNAARLDRTLFARVFSDAHVIELDFSEWDKRIAVWVLADHYEEWTGRCPLVVAEFNRVLELSYRMAPTDVLRDSPNEHIQWRICDFELRESEESVWVRLFGVGVAPSLEIASESVSFRRVDTEILDRAFPGWSKPSNGLVRPSLASELAKTQRASEH